jgi:hypothetical protein
MTRGLSFWAPEHMVTEKLHSGKTKGQKDKTRTMSPQTSVTALPRLHTTALELLKHTRTLHSSIVYFNVLLLTADLPSRVLAIHYHRLENLLSALQLGFGRLVMAYMRRKNIRRSASSMESYRTSPRSSESPLVEDWEWIRGRGNADGFMMVEVRDLLMQLDGEVEGCEYLLDDAVDFLSPESDLERQ